MIKLRLLNLGKLNVFDTNYFNAVSLGFAFLPFGIYLLFGIWNLKFGSWDLEFVSCYLPQSDA